VELDLWQYYQTNAPGQVQVLGVDLWNGTLSQVNGFKGVTGATFPLLLNGATASGGNLSQLYGTYDNYLVINKQGIVRYHAQLRWPAGNRYHLGEIRAAVDSLLAPVVSADGAAPAGFALDAVPNPSRGAVRLSFANPTGAPLAARVEVFDLIGRRVARLWEGPAPAGVTTLSWDGRDGSGRALAPGVYLVDAIVGPQRIRRRVVRVE
jgi:hypothetical protein